MTGGGGEGARGPKAGDRNPPSQAPQTACCRAGARISLILLFFSLPGAFAKMTGLVRILC